jgi:hypothetical protein
MRAENGIARHAALFCFAAAALLPAGSHAQGTADTWQWRASIYGWFPSIDGSTRFPTGGTGPTLDVDAGDVIDALKFTFMGALEGRKGQWGVFTDVLYVDLGATKSGSRDFTVGQMGLPAGVTVNASLDIKSWVWTLAGTYGLDNTKQNTTDLLFGARMLYMKQTLDWAFNGNIGSLGLPGASGRSQVDDTNWDVVVGLKGVATISDDRRWVLPYYLDIGAGQSKFTWQALAGVGYSFDWGTATLAWRYLDYEFKSDAPIEDMNFSGPLLGVSFKF